MGGSSSCLQVTSENNVQEFFDEVRNAFGQVGYDGIFDVEALRVGEKIYLNEINWRNSGTIYSVFGSKVYYPVNWYYWKTENQSPENFIRTCLDDTVYTMDESLDLRHVACGSITLRQWLNDKKKASLRNLGCDRFETNYGTVFSLAERVDKEAWGEKWVTAKKF